MTNQEVVQKLKSLKQIKPNQEWVILSKNNILANRPVVQPVKAEFVSVSGSIFQTLFSRKLAYSFAVLLIAFLGVFGVMRYGVFNSGQSEKPVVLSQEVKTNLEKFKTNSKDLALVARTDPANASVIAGQVKEAAEALTEAVKKDPEIAREIALDVNNNKAYAELSSEVEEASNNLEKVLAEQLYQDYEENQDSLTDEQKDQLKGI